MRQLSIETGKLSEKLHGYVVDKCGKDGRNLYGVECESTAKVIELGNGEAANNTRKFLFPILSDRSDLRLAACRPQHFATMKGNDAITSRVLRRKSKRFWYFSLAIVLLLILAVIIPVAFVFSQRRHPKGLKSTVLVPLYIYPVPGAWEPLHEA